ncbi:hypothetical protein BOBR111200_24950 [Bordetella bronchialis]
MKAMVPALDSAAVSEDAVTFQVLLVSMLTASGSMRPVSTVPLRRATDPLLPASAIRSPFSVTPCASRLTTLALRRFSSVPDAAVIVVPARTLMLARAPVTSIAWPACADREPPLTEIVDTLPVPLVSVTAIAAVPPWTAVSFSATAPPALASTPGPPALRSALPLALAAPAGPSTCKAAALGPVVVTDAPINAAVAPLSSMIPEASSPAVATVALDSCKVPALLIWMPAAPAPVVAMCPPVTSTSPLAPDELIPAEPEPLVEISVSVKAITPPAAWLFIAIPVPLTTMVPAVPTTLPPVAVASSRMPSAVPCAWISPLPEKATDAPAPVRCTAALPSLAWMIPLFSSHALAPCTSAPSPCETCMVELFRTAPWAPTTTPMDERPDSTTLLLLTRVPRLRAAKPVTPSVADCMAALLVSVVATGSPQAAPVRSWPCPSTMPAVAPPRDSMMTVPASMVPAAPPSLTMATAPPAAPAAPVTRHVELPVDIVVPRPVATTPRASVPDTVVSKAPPEDAPVKAAPSATRNSVERSVSTVIALADTLMVEPAPAAKNPIWSVPPRKRGTEPAATFTVPPCWANTPMPPVPPRLIAPVTDALPCAPSTHTPKLRVPLAGSALPLTLMVPLDSALAAMPGSALTITPIPLTPLTLMTPALRTMAPVPAAPLSSASMPILAMGRPPAAPLIVIVPLFCSSEDNGAVENIATAFCACDPMTIWPSLMAVSPVSMMRTP